MTYNMRPNRSRNKRYSDWTGIKGKVTIDLTQYEVKVVDKSVYHLCLFGGKTDCPFKCKPVSNSENGIRSHLWGHYRRDKTISQSIGGRKRRRNKGQNEYQCREKGCRMSYIGDREFSRHKKLHLCGFTVRPLADEEICSDFNIRKLYEYCPDFDCGTVTYRCLKDNCPYESPFEHCMRKHVHCRHVCPNRGTRFVRIGNKYELIEWKSKYNRLENKSKTRDELKSNEKSDEKSREEELPSDECRSDYDLRSDESGSDPELPLAENGSDESMEDLNYETSSEDDLASQQSVSDPQTDSNRMNSILNIGNNNKRKIVNKIKSKKTIAKTFKCSEKYCNQRFKHKMLFIKHKNWHKNNANKNSLTKVSPNVNHLLDEIMRRVDIKIEERLSQQKSRPKEETNDVNENHCMNDTNEDSIELIDLTVDESEDIKPNDMSEQNRNHINTTLIKAEPMDDISNDSNTRPTIPSISTLIKAEPIAKGLDLNESNANQLNQLNRSDAKPSTSSLGWRAKISEIDPSEQFMFTEMTKSIDSVAKKFGNASQNKYFWTLVAKHMTDSGYKGFDAFDCYHMFNLFAHKYYYLVLANSPDETTANEVYPLFAFIHSLDLTQSLIASKFNSISALRQLFAQKSTNV